MFQNRQQAGKLLAAKLRGYRGRKDVIVFAIARGGVPVGKEVATFLTSPFDIIVVKKIGAPHNPELAIGAVGPSETVYWDNSLIRSLHVDKVTKDKELRIKNQEREEKERLLRQGKRYRSIEGKTVIVVDDGVATGATSIVAGKFVKNMRAKKSILATPVIAKDTLLKVKRYFDDVVYLEASEEFHAVGQFYEEFNQVTDGEVARILNAEMGK